MKSCAVCTEVQAKYRCPGCGVETCSLSCVRKHKADTACTGQRDKTAYVKLTDFSDINLLSDYRFLEEGGRKTSNAVRDTLNRSSNKPNYLKNLEKQARNRNIRLRLMPYPMSKRKHNSSYFNHKTKKIFWQIEWVFTEAEYTTVDKRVCESECLQTLLDHHTGPGADPLRRHRLQAYCRAEAGDVGVFMQCPGTSKEQARYYQLDKGKSLLENLADKEIVEYPSLHVVLKPHWTQYTLVENSSQASELRTLPGGDRSTSNLDEKSSSSNGNNDSSQVVLDCEIGSAINSQNSIQT